MRATKLFAAAVMATSALAFLPARSALAEVQVGVLTCTSVPGSRVNLIVRSTVDIKCVLKYAGGQVEKYKGDTGIALGLDLSFKKDEKFAFSVVSASNVKPGSYAAAGKYVGGKASASAGVGLGAAALVGGSNDTFGLNPLAIETNQGVGVAAGIGFLYIEPDK